MIVTPCPVCQMNVEVYEDKINASCGTGFGMPVTCYSTLMSVAYRRNGKHAGLDGPINAARKLEEIAGK